MNSSNKVSIVIPIFNQSHLTQKCIQKIYENTSNEYPFEIIIVDNASFDDSDMVVKEFQKSYNNVKYIKLDNNYKFAKACNIGADNSDAEYLIFLNNDTEPLTGWLERGLERLKSDDKIGIVGSKLLYEDGKIQHCGIEFFKDVNPDYYLWPLHRYLGYESDDPLVNVPEEVTAVTGACLFIKRSLFNEVGQFSIEYGMYFEDTDLNFKVRKKELQIFYEPASVVIHLESKSVENKSDVDKFNASAAKIFYKKWQREIDFLEFSLFIEKKTGNISFVNPGIYPSTLINNTYTENRDESLNEYLKFLRLVESVGDSYIHFGGAGDALLLLSTFYDDNPYQTIISFANSSNALASFFSSFNRLKRVFIVPLPPTNILHMSLRKILPRLNNVLGMGATPRADYATEWANGLNIFRTYNIKEENQWAVDFRAEKVEPFQVTIAPKGSLVGMVGSKKNMISQSDWKNTVKYFLNRGIRPIILGTPDEESMYPLISGSIDKRSYSFSEQMKLIASSDLFIGADSWGKTFAALAGVKTFVYVPQKGADLKNWVDASDFVFIKPWKKITLVENFNKLKIFLRVEQEQNKENISISIHSEVKNGNSLSYVSSELALQLLNNYSRLRFGNKEKTDLSFFNNSRYKILSKHLYADSHSDITISHCFPPENNRPSTKKWIIIQPWEFGSIPQNWLEIFSKADEIWVPSNFVRNIYIKDGVSAEKVIVVPNGVNTSIFNVNEKRYKLTTKKKIKLLFVGGTIFRKGIDLLLKVYTNVFNSRDDVCLIIKDVGVSTSYQNRNYSQQIIDISKLNGVAEIEYINKHLTDSELSALYNTCDYLIHPYRGEGFGLPILEAMACGLIPVVTQGGATDDFCNESNSIKIKSIIKNFETNYVDKMPTVNTPWMLEPDLDHLKLILKDIYTNHIDIKNKFSNISSEIQTNWDWKTVLNEVPLRINNLIKNKSHDNVKSVKTTGEYDVNECFRKINDLVLQSRYDEALQYVSQQIKSNKKINEEDNLVQLLDLAGNISLVKNDFSAAQVYFEKELQTNPISSTACKGLGDVFIARENYEAAKTMFEWAVKNDPNNQNAVSSLEEVNFVLGIEKSHNSLLIED